MKRGSEHHSWRPALQRFAEKCRFDATTGCVLWIGGTSSGRGNTARYGRFYDDGAIWYAHRWGAVHIHKLNLGTCQVGHICPAGPNTLCVEHIEAQSQLENLAEQHSRMKARQSALQRQFWLFVQLGLEPEPERQVIDLGAIPFYTPPAWFSPFMEKLDECPF